MSSKAQRNKGWPIPDPHIVPDRVCFQMEIPNDLAYIAAMLGTVAQLGKWWNWEKSYVPGDTRATEVAEMWRDAMLTYQILPDCNGGGNLPYTLTFDGCNLVLSENGTPVSSVDLTNPDLQACLPEGPQGDPGETGPAGPPGQDCDCTESPVNDDGGVPDISQPPSSSTRCSVATGVVNSLLDNYYIPALNNYIEQRITNGLNYLQWVENFRNALIGGTLGTFFNANPAGLFALLGGILAGPAAAFMAWHSAVDAQNALNILNDAQNSATRDELKCFLYCRLDNSGNMSSDVYSGWIADIAGSGLTLAADLSTFLSSMIPLHVARTEAFITAATPGDCSGCECEGCIVWDFKTDNRWLIFSQFNNSPTAVWTQGIGWRRGIRNGSARAGMSIERPSGLEPSTQLCEKVEITYMAIEGEDLNQYYSNYIRLRGQVGTTTQVFNEILPWTGGQMITHEIILDPPVAINRLVLLAVTANSSSAVATKDQGDLIVERVVLHPVTATPLWTDSEYCG